ncbi:pentapeptide repeat-containing protein [Egbenema bharatensis]|uniref:pentapeptide repeat-containing protein n=1 Tax=Egbenema bharatensis TaxID=3463334 RepID=UPI003A83A906
MFRNCIFRNADFRNCIFRNADFRNGDGSPGNSDRNPKSTSRSTSRNMGRSTSDRRNSREVV